MELSHFTTAEMLTFEQFTSDHFGVSVDQMMQQAGQSLHDFVVAELPEVRNILVVAGKGNNGGDALVAGGMLAESGFQVTSIRLDSDFPENFDFTRFDLIIDGLFGFSLKGDPCPPMNQIIEQINCSKVPVLSVDVPSGLEVYTGKVMKPTIKATYTLALGMPKKGLSENPDYAGKVYLGHLGIPREAYEAKGIVPPDFSKKNYLALD